MTGLDREILKGLALVGTILLVVVIGTLFFRRSRR